MQRDSASPERTAPPSRSHPFGHSQRGKSEAIEHAAGDRLLARPQTAPNLFDRDHADPRFRARSSQGRESSGGGPAAKRIDKDSRIKEHARHGQPARRGSARRCWRTHTAGSSSHSCPVSGKAPRAASMSSQRRSSSRPRWMSSVMKALRRRGPARRSISRTRSCSRTMCRRMGLKHYSTHIRSSASSPAPQDQDAVAGTRRSGWRAP